MSEGMYCYRWPRPGYTADCVIFRPSSAAPQFCSGSNMSTEDNNLSADGNKSVDSNTSTGSNMSADNWDVLLIKRGNNPFKGAWALPGGYVNEYEELPKAAARELREETGITGVELYFIDTFGEKGRDPRGWTITGAFCGLLPAGQQPVAGDDAADFQWFSLANLPDMAFDHGKIIAAAIETMRSELKRAQSL